MKRTASRRKWFGLTATALVTALAATALGATPASAAPVTFSYDITGGSAYVKKVDAAIELGTGTLTADIDLATGNFSALMDLETAHGQFSVFGIRVTADVNMVQTKPATGTILRGQLTGTAEVIMKMSNVRVFDVPVFVGDDCQTLPVTVPLASTEGFNPLVGGEIASDPDFTIPHFQGCRLITVLPWVVDLALDAFVSGPGNTMAINVAWPTDAA
jgi:hypothetical protein